MSVSPSKSFVGKQESLSRLLPKGLAALLGAVILAAVLPVAAHGDVEKSKSSRVPLPSHVAEKGDKCVEDEDYMRRNHMNLLKHQRDETMHKGIRTTKYSLKNCIECHASKKTNSVIGTTDGKDNFCQGCHSYVGVKLDCFECHSSKPKAPAGEGHPIVTPAPQAEGQDKHSGLLHKMPHKGTPAFYALPGAKDRMRWQMQDKMAGLNIGEGVK